MTRDELTTLINNHLEKTGMKPADLSEKIVGDRGGSTIYQWMNGKAFPTEKYRKTLAKELGIPAKDLVRTTTEYGPVRKAIVAYTPRNEPKSKPRTQMTYVANEDGTVTISINATLSREASKLLFKTILEINET